MSDRLEQLGAALAARAGAGIVGWRAGAPVSNAQFLARAHAWHALLCAQAGRHFALYLDDSLEFGAALLGAWHAGKTIWLGADTLPATCAALRASVDGFLGQFPAEQAPLQAPDPDGGAAPPAGSAPLACALDGAMPALVVFTSGSTGVPQAIPKRLAQLAHEVATLEELFGARAGAAAVLATVSHQHIYGLLFKVLWPLCGARPIQAASIAYPEELAQAAAAGPCVLVASPAHLKRLPEHLDWRAAAARVRVVFSSGGPLPDDAARATAALLGTVPVEVYGSSETGGIAWRQRRALEPAAAPGAPDADTAWQAFPTVAWRLAPDGALEVRSPHLEQDDWYTLADRAVAAAPGAQGGKGEEGEEGEKGGTARFLLRGRADRIVKIEEKRVSLSALEAALAASGLAAEARVVVCPPQGKERQRVAAVVVPSAAGRALLDAHGKQALNSRLRAVLATVVEAVALPRRWRYVERLPVNAQGKTTVADLLALLDAADAAAGPPADGRPRLPRMRELERAPQRVLLEVTAPADLLYFDGHFDVAPILPGVVQVDWALHYGRQHFPLPARFKAIAQLKFQQVIVPGQPVQLELVHDTARDSLQFRYQSAAGSHASGRIVLGDGDD